MLRLPQVCLSHAKKILCCQRSNECRRPLCSLTACRTNENRATISENLTTIKLVFPIKVRKYKNFVLLTNFKATQNNSKYERLGGASKVKISLGLDNKRATKKTSILILPF